MSTALPARFPVTEEERYGALIADVRKRLRQLESKQGFTAPGSIIGDTYLKVGSLTAAGAVIGSLSADVITTGTLTASTITLGAGGRLQTAASGARAVFDSTGVYSTNSGGSERFRLAASTGDATLAGKLTVTGSIETAASGARTVMDAAGFKAYNSGGSLTFHVKSSSGDTDLTGNLTVASGGIIRTAAAGARFEFANTYLRAFDSGGATVFEFLTATGNLFLKGTLIEGSALPPEIVGPVELDKDTRFTTLQSFHAGFADVSRWVQIVGPGTFTSQTPGDARFGGSVGRAAGYVWKEWPDNVPFDPDVLYRVEARVRQTVDPTNAQKQIFVGVAGVAADGVTRVNVTGANSAGNQHYIAAAGQTVVAGTTWTTFVGYFKGRGATGSSGTSDPTAPGVLHNDVRYFRPLFILNYNGGDGTAEIDELAVSIMEIPDASISTARIKDLAVTDAKINTLTVGKLSTGSLSAAVVTLTASGYIQTGGGAASRGQFDNAGLRFYNAGGVMTFDANASGAFTLQSATSGARIAMESSQGIRGYDSGGALRFHLQTSTGDVALAGKLTVTGGIETASSGARVALDQAGLYGKDSGGVDTFRVDRATGNTTLAGTITVSGTATLTGTIQTAASGARTQIASDGVTLYNSSGTVISRYAHGWGLIFKHAGGSLERIRWLHADDALGCSIEFPPSSSSWNTYGHAAVGSGACDSVWALYNAGETRNVLIRFTHSESADTRDCQLQISPTGGGAAHIATLLDDDGKTTLKELVVNEQSTSARLVTLNQIASGFGDFIGCLDSTGAPKFQVLSTGAPLITGSAANTGTYRSKVTGDTNDRLNITAAGRVILGPGNATGDLRYERTAAGTLTFSAASGSVLQLIVKAAASQTADLMQFQNSASTVLSVVDAAGRLGIGTATPTTVHASSRMTVTATDATAVFGALQNTGTGQVGLLLDRSGGTVAQWLEYIPSGSTDRRWWAGADRMILTAAGALSTSTGVLSTISGLALKRNVRPVAHALSTVLALRGRRWEWTRNELVDAPKLGFVADEVEEVLPELVDEIEWNLSVDPHAPPETFKTVQRGALEPYFVEAFREVVERIERLEAAAA